jgi:hypothetical protein
MVRKMVPPPPPPPPVRNKAAAQGAGAAPVSAAGKSRGKGSGSAPFVLLGGLGLLYVGLTQAPKAKRALEERGWWPSEESNNGASAGWLGGLVGKKQPPPEENLARKYLEDMAAKGDESAKKVLVATERSSASNSFDEKDFREDFRLNVSAEGLTQTLSMMLRMRIVLRPFLMFP